jgi:hypothetical protein
VKKLLAALGVGVLMAVVPTVAANAAPPPQSLDGNLATLWTTVFETPAPQNAFGTGSPATACWDLGQTVAPLGPNGVGSCTVTPHTSLFVAGFTNECSTFEEPNLTTEAELRACAKAGDPATAPPITVDGAAVSVTEAYTPLLNIVLGGHNLFGLPPGTQGLSVGHAWATLVNPLPLGTHSVVITLPSGTITTTIIVTNS